MKWRCCFLVSLLVLCWCLAFTKQQSLDSDDYEESFEGIDDIMKEMEALAELDVDFHESKEMPSIEPEVQGHGPTTPPSTAETSKSYYHKNSVKEKQHSTINHLQSKRGSSKKKSKMKRNPLSDNESAKAPPVAAGGAYYGGDIDRDKKEALKQKQQKPAASKTGPSKIRTNKMSSMSSNRFQELEDQLSETVRINMAFAEKQQSDREHEKYERQTRFKIPRRYAAPVERIISTYDDPKSDLYMVLKVPNTADEFTLKRQYRTLALQIHPDKNPHPDAKAAFDAIQDAYDILANPTKRQEYDRELKKFARARAWTLKKLKLKVREVLHNLSAQILLAWYQYRRGEAIDDWLQWKNNWKQRFLEITQFFEHIYLLPSFMDKLQLVQEVGCRNWLPLVMLITLVPVVRHLSSPKAVHVVADVPILLYDI